MTVAVPSCTWSLTGTRTAIEPFSSAVAASSQAPVAVFCTNSLLAWVASAFEARPFQLSTRLSLSLTSPTFSV